jgi:hypothetical protein
MDRHSVPESRFSQLGPVGWTSSISPGEYRTRMTTPAPAFSLQGSRQFVSWLGEVRASLAFSTYQSGKLFLLGVQEDGRFSVFERTFERVMGLCASPDAQTLWIGTLWQLWRFENAVPPGQVANGFRSPLRAAVRLHHRRRRYSRHLARFRAAPGLREYPLWLPRHPE